MARLLSIETATRTCSVALSEDGVLVALKETTDERYSHAEKLTVFIQELLSDNNWKASDLDAVAVSKGPGSYTGLRIGVSTAKGLCYALSIPLLAVSTLQAMAKQIADVDDTPADALLCPMIDARRMEVYAALYHTDMSEKRGIAADIVDERTYSSYLDQGKVIFFGDGAGKCADLLSENPNAHFVADINPSAREVGLLAFEKLSKGDTEDVAYFEPFYLKDFVAGKPKKLV